MAAFGMDQPPDGLCCDILRFHERIMAVCSAMDFAAATFHPGRIRVDGFVSLIRGEEINQPYPRFPEP